LVGCTTKNVLDMDLHQQAIELMEKLDEKYQLKDEKLSLDEYLYENVYKLSDEEIDKCINLIDRFE